jgi:hypothetical protein
MMGKRSRSSRPNPQSERGGFRRCKGDVVVLLASVIYQEIIPLQKKQTFFGKTEEKNRNQTMDRQEAKSAHRGYVPTQYAIDEALRCMRCAHHQFCCFSKGEKILNRSYCDVMSSEELSFVPGTATKADPFCNS